MYLQCLHELSVLLIAPTKQPSRTRILGPAPVSTLAPVQILCHIVYTGGACLFGGNMEARIYQHCLVPNDTHKNDEPYAEILHES